MHREIEIGNNCKIGFDDQKTKVYENVGDWLAEGRKRFGQDVKKWKYICPMCGHVATVQDFIDNGIDEYDAANYAYGNCLGRVTGKGSPKEGDSSGCNWTAYGLFGIPEGGVIVMTGDGKGTHIFDFAAE